MCIFWEAVPFFFWLLPTSCRLKCGCDCLYLEQNTVLGMVNHEREGVKVPALWNAVPASDCWLLDSFYMNEKYTPISDFHHCYFRFHSLQMNSMPTHITDSIDVKNSKCIYICISNGWFWLWCRSPQDNLLQHWRPIILHNNKSRGGALLRWLI